MGKEKFSEIKSYDEMTEEEKKSWCRLIWGSGKLDRIERDLGRRLEYKEMPEGLTDREAWGFLGMNPIASNYEKWRGMAKVESRGCIPHGTGCKCCASCSEGCSDRIYEE